MLAPIPHLKYCVHLQIITDVALVTNYFTNMTKLTLLLLMWLFLYYCYQHDQVGQQKHHRYHLPELLPTFLKKVA